MHRILVALTVLFIGVARAQTPVASTIETLAQNDAILKQAEISLALSDGRVVVGTLGGLNELRKYGSVTAVVPLRTPAISGCYYAGLVEHQGMLYASCSTNWGRLDAQAYLMAAPITPDLTATEFKVIAMPAGIKGSNNLAFDGKGSFYLSDSGVFSGKIVQLRLTSPTTVSAPKTVYTSALRPNGIRYDPRANAIYFTENAYTALYGYGTANLKKATLAADGGFSNITRLYTASNHYLDGFALTASGVVLPDPIHQELFHLEEATGKITLLAKDLGATSATFRCATCRELLVTDGFKHAVYQVTPTSALLPR